MNTSLANFISDYAGILEDGEIDHQEKKLLKTQVPELIQILENLLGSIK